jgi:hypothetical protein
MIGDDRMMTNEEQQAFVEAYGRNVAEVSDAKVAEFVRSYALGEDLDYSSYYTSVMDALGMWNEGIKWQMQQARKAVP